MTNNVYYFTASWCGPCKSIYPEIESLNNKYENVNFYKIDVDDEENEDLCSNYNVTSIPNFLFFKEGREVGRVKGADIKAVEKIINESFL
jgi:thioredoxin 1